MNRMRTTVAALAATGALTAAQLGLAGAASASTAATQAKPNCPIKIIYLKDFDIDSNYWVTEGGLEFGIKNTSKKQSFKNVSFTVTVERNLVFGKAKTTTKLGWISKRTKTKVTISTKNLKANSRIAFKVRTKMNNTKKYGVKWALSGNKAWDCAKDQGTWGTLHK